jgi:phage terminase large subunit-like protein
MLPDWLASVHNDPSYEWAIRAWKSASAVPGAWFDINKANKIVEAWPQIFRLTDDRFKGVPFKLLPWQSIAVRLLVGWKKPIELMDPVDHSIKVEWVRIIRRLDLWLPRKNGKSEFLAALGVLFFVVEKVQRAQGYVFGRTEDQGRVPFTKMQDIIKEANGLLEDDKGNVRISLSDKGIFLKETSSLCELLTGQPDGKHGRSPTVIVGDEIHEWKTRELADTLRQGTGARLQPIELYASTAGRRQNRTGYEWFEESMAIMRGDLIDPTTLVVFFGAAEDDDWMDEAVWKKANPSLGLSPTLDYLRTESSKAKGKPHLEAIFRCYHLNIWVDQTSGWITRPQWQSCQGDISWHELAEKHKGRKGFVAIDVSSTRDLTARAVVLPPDDDCEFWVILPRFWVPEGTLAERAEQDRRVNWQSWVNMGALTATPGDAVDQNYVMKDVLDVMSEFKIEAIGFDPWNARKLMGDLQADGVDSELMVEMRQGAQTLGPPTKELERLILSERIRHGQHPVLSWMMGHCQIRFDQNLNYLPCKKSSLDKIDGVVAAIMGLGLAIAVEDKNEAEIHIL